MGAQLNEPISNKDREKAISISRDYWSFLCLTSWPRIISLPNIHWVVSSTPAYFYFGGLLWVFARGLQQQIMPLGSLFVVSNFFYCQNLAYCPYLNLVIRCDSFLKLESSHTGGAIISDVVWQDRLRTWHLMHDWHQPTKPHCFIGFLDLFFYFCSREGKTNKISIALLFVVRTICYHEAYKKEVDICFFFWNTHKKRSL